MRMIRVTEVIAPWTDFSKVPPDVLQNAATRGTAVHEICARIAAGEFVMGIPDDLFGYVDSFRQWFDSQVARVILAEERLFDHQWGFSGQIDLVVEAKSDGLVWLVDIKTPVTAYPQWKMQIAAYRNLLMKEKGILPKRTGSLQLDPDGKVPRMKWYEDSATDLNAFLSALNVYRYINQ